MKLRRVVAGHDVRFLVAALALGSLSGACRDATEIKLDVWTNMPCTDPTAWRGIAVYTGKPGLDLETKAPAMTSAACDGSGHIGTLVVVPKDANDEEVGLRVVAGLMRAPEDCAANGYAGCIVARRTLTYVPHTTTDLRIDLDSLCENQGCDLLHTCVDGACDDARIDVPPAPADAAPNPSVRCGDNAVRCATTGNVCCLEVDLDAGTATGSCRARDDCPPGTAVLKCDDNSDCPGGAVCCVVGAGQGGVCQSFEGQGGGTECVDPITCGTQVVLCEELNPCPVYLPDGGFSGTSNECAFSNYFPHYSSCCQQ
jgi:hypothetical protein